MFPNECRPYLAGVVGRGAQLKFLLRAGMLPLGRLESGGEAGAELWTHLRLLFCRAVWYLRCCRVAHGQVFSASAVVALASSWLRRAIRLDWLRVSADLAGTALTLSAFLVRHSQAF